MVTKKLHSTAPKNNYLKDLITSWVIVFVFGLLIGNLISMVVIATCNSDEEEPEEIKTIQAKPMQLNYVAPERPYTATETSTEPIAIETIAYIEEIETAEPEKEFLGNFRITAYCSCKKCCGKWADNRPNGIVYGASGEELKAGHSVASTLPFGTELHIDGLGDYVVQDRFASWVVEKYGQNIVDVYFDNHEEACQFGLKYLDVYEIRGNNK